ncbi:MAG: CHASE2 domain-containing protein [Candidatus Acidiferrales bacterium]
MSEQAQRSSGWSAWLGKASLHRIVYALAIFVTLAGLTLFVFSGFGGNTHAGFVFIQNLEQQTLDLRFELRGRRAHDPRIVIVGIDEKTLQKIGSFPFPRNSYALLVNRLGAGGARVVALDATFPTPETNSAGEALEKLKRALGPSASPALLKQIEQLEAASDQDAKFAAALKSAANVVLGHVFLDPTRAQSSDPKLAEAYFNIVWAKNFPQVLKVKSKDGLDFDLSAAWADRSHGGGTVAAGVEANIAKLAEAAASYGFININPDPDGTLRHALLIIRYRDQDFFPSLALQVVREYERIPDQDIAAYIASDGLDRIQFGRHEIRRARDGSALINYTGPYHTYQHYSMWDVLSGELPPETFRDKIVLVGATAIALGDMRNTPFAAQDPVFMGVEVHANIIDNVLHSEERGRGFLTRGFNEEMIDLGFILLFGLGFGFLFGPIEPRWSTIALIVALAGYAWFVFYMFAAQGRWLSFVIPSGTLVVNYAAITSFRMFFEEREKRKIRKTFSQYLSPEVIGLIEKDPQRYIRPGGEMKELTVMFSDIRSFTTISEGLTPDELVSLLNEYLGEMTETIFANQGTLDKYIGDAIMAFWGSPYPQADHAVRGCHCAVHMVRSLEKLNFKWKSEGRTPISIGIGLNTGLLNVGNMGSAKRLAWTVMGDNVNLASRLEGINKEYHTQIVISEATYSQVAEQFVCRELDKIKVKGKNQPVNIYELLDVISEKQKYESLLGKFNRAMTAYRAQNWSEAIEKFRQLLAAHPEDGPARMFLQRAEEFLWNAPEPDWDGVYVMKTK